MMNKSRKAFTLVELLVVVGTIGLLVSFLLVAKNALLSQSEELITKRALADTAKAIEAFRSDWGMLPETLEYLTNVNRIRELAAQRDIEIVDFKPYIRQEITDDSVVLGWADLSFPTSLATQNSELVNNHGGQLSWIPGRRNWGAPLNSTIIVWLPKGDWTYGGDIRDGDITRSTNFWFPVLDGWGNPLLYFKRHWIDPNPKGNPWWTHITSAPHLEITHDGTYMLFSAGPDWHVYMDGFSFDRRTYGWPDYPPPWNYMWLHGANQTHRISYGFFIFHLDWHHINTGWQYDPPRWRNYDSPYRGRWVPMMTRMGHYNWPVEHNYNKDNIYHEGTPRRYNNVDKTIS